MKFLSECMVGVCECVSVICDSSNYNDVFIILTKMFPGQIYTFSQASNLPLLQVIYLCNREHVGKWKFNSSIYIMYGI